jgi:hypothetical protein
MEIGLWAEGSAGICLTEPLCSWLCCPSLWARPPYTCFAPCLLSTHLLPWTHQDCSTWTWASVAAGGLLGGSQDVLPEIWELWEGEDGGWKGPNPAVGTVKGLGVGRCAAPSDPVVRDGSDSGILSAGVLHAYVGLGTPLPPPHSESAPDTF